MNFTKKDCLVLLIYVLLILANFFVIGRLGLGPTAMQAARLIVIALNAFIVLYAYRGVLGADWRAFRGQKWTKWLVIVGAFAVIWAMMTIIRRIGAPAEKIVEEAALEALGQDSLATGAATGGAARMAPVAFTLTLLAALIPLLSAVTEEVMFRYVLMFKHSLGGRAVQGAMLVLSSVAFGLIHYQALGSVAATVPYIFVALLLGTLYLWRRNIWYNIFAHMLFNGVNVAMALFGLILQAQAFA
jgi:membrane protease YdiL (CAAX protease family)